MVNVLFVCLGNICRSPMAEGIFRDAVIRAGLPEHIAIDSCGTSDYHVDDHADRRSISTLRQRSIDITAHRARQFSRHDFGSYHYILPMDRSNHEYILLKQQTLRIPERPGQIFLMRHFDSQADSPDVPDPYYGGLDGFENVADMLTRASESLLAHIRKEQNL